jgi:Ca2+-binding EF-hand superfamily protein
MTTHAIYSNKNLIGGTLPLDPAAIVAINTMEKNLYLAIVDFNKLFGKTLNVHDWAYLDSLSAVRSAIFTNKNPYMVVAYAIFLSCNFEVEDIYHALMRLLILDNADHKVVDAVTLALRSFLKTVEDVGQKNLIDDQRKRVQDAWTSSATQGFEPGVASKKMNEVIDEVVRTMAQNTTAVGTAPGEKITLEELRAMIKKENEKRSTLGKLPLEYTEDEIKEIFDELDEDPVQSGGNPKDFRISKTDGELILRALIDPKLTKKGSNTSNVKVTYDLDQLITKIDSYGYKDIKDTPRADLQRIFNTIDVNQNGVIDESELPKFIVEVNTLLTKLFNTKIADTFADKLLEADKELQALKDAQLKGPPKEANVDLSSAKLNLESFIDTVLALNNKSQGAIVGKEVLNKDFKSIKDMPIAKDLTDFFKTISKGQDEMSYSDYIAALRLIDNELLSYLRNKGTGTCPDSGKVAEFKAPASTDSLIDRIIKSKGVNVRDMKYSDYKGVMDELKLEIESSQVPYVDVSTKINLNKVAAQDPATAASVAGIKKALADNKIKPMISGLAIENVFKEIAGSDTQISPKELMDFMTQYGVPLTIEQATNLIKSLDVDGDGTLGIVEFASLIGKQNPTNDIIEQYRQLFEGLKDGKPSLAVADLMALIKKHNKSSNIDELVDKADLNKDGHIDFDEFLNLMIEESKDVGPAKVSGGNSKREFISNRDSMDYVISRNESLRDRVRLIGKYKPSNLKKK